MQFWIKCTRHQDGAPCFVNISMVGLMHREGDRTILEFVGDGISSTDVRETPERILELHLGSSLGVTPNSAHRRSDTR